MKVKTSDLVSPALDWAAAQCVGEECKVGHVIHSIDNPHELQCLSTDWSEAGHIIEREGISVIRASDDYGVDSKGNCNNKRIPVWCASAGQNRATKSTEGQSHDFMYQIYESSVMYGPTPLIAAMRCFVAKKLGKEVEIPDGICANIYPSRRRTKML